MVDIVDIKQCAVEAALKEYESLREEMLLRITSKRQVLTWLITLTIATLGAFLSVKPINDKTLIALLLDSNLDGASASQVIIISLVTLGGYVAASEVLIAFWLFQLYMIFQMSQYIMQRANLLQGELGYTGNIKFFYWESSFGTGIGEKSPQRAEKASFFKVALWFISLYQPLPMLFLTLTGLGFYSYLLLYQSNAPQSAIAVLVAWALWIILALLIAAFVVLHIHQKKMVAKSHTESEAIKANKKDTKGVQNNGEETGTSRNSMGCCE